MLEHQLREELSRVGQRLGRLWLWQRLTWCWVGFGIIAACWWLAGRPYSGILSIIVGGSWLVATLLWVKSKALGLSKSDLARCVEQAFPELNSRLLAALEQAPEVQTGQLNILQRQVISEALHHSRINNWSDAVPVRKMRNAFVRQTAALIAFCGFCVSLIPASTQGDVRITETSPAAMPAVDYSMPAVEPGDCEIERGTSMLVLARFGGPLPAAVQLRWRDEAASSGSTSSGDGHPTASPISSASTTTSDTSPQQHLSLTKSLDDPVFGGRMAAVNRDMRYLIEFDGKQTREYKVVVYDLPALIRSDLELQYPSYTGLESKTLEDAFDAVVVEGTTITVTCRVNKPLASVKLVENETTTIELTATPSDPTIVQGRFVPTKRHRMKLVLKDGAGRTNRDSEEFRFEAVPNRPPELKLAFPAQDVKVSPIEEMLVEATATDDFGLVETGVVMSVPGRDPISISLDQEPSTSVKGKAGLLKKTLSHLQQLEEMKVEPDQLISYYVYADDFGPDGAKRRTTSDLFFAEVRPFEEIFRQLEAPPGGQSQASGSQQQENPLTKLSTLQKQIVVATWNLVRSSNVKWDEKTAEKVSVIRDSQQKAIEQLEALSEKLSDAKSQPILTAIGEQMSAANRSLGQSISESSLSPLTAATVSEQAAYQGLLKLRAREHLMMQGSQSASGSSGNASPSEQQMQQLELDNKKNRYESQRTAQQQTGQTQREELAMFDRLKELANRQQGVNEKLKELEAALRTAKSEAEKEELERQLRRLRDDQQQLLHDADELRNKMSQSSQQEKLADTRQQLEQTRKQMVDATEKLREGQLSQALSAGTRAERELQQLQEDFRKQTAAQFAEAMRNLRDEARQLSENEKQLSERLSALQDESNRSLRQSKDRQALEAEFKQQRDLANSLVDAAKEVVEQSETAEPLLSKQLYDSVRSSREMKTDQALDATSQLLRAGFVPEAQKAEEQARAGIEKLKSGIEQAAEGILGDEVESLKRAKRELTDLAEQLDKEIAMQQQNGGGKKSNDEGDAESKENPATQGSGKESRPASGEQPNKDGPTSPDKSANPGNNEGTTPEGSPSNDGQSNPSSGKQTGSEQKGQSGRNASPGKGQSGSPDDKSETQQSGKSSNEQAKTPGQGSQGQGSGGQGDSPGQQPSGAEPSNRSGRAGLRGQQQQAGGSKPGAGNPDSNSEQSGFGGGGGSQGGPLTGENFADWNERLRDVESMISDPKLQAEVSKIRERARSVRAEFKRHSKDPNWDVVRSTVSQPLTELQRQLAEEIAKRESPDSLVPVDRDPVPTRYRDLVRGYYERLGSGKAEGAKPDTEKKK